MNFDSADISQNSNSFKEVDIDKNHQKFHCRFRDIQVSWSRCMENYTSATAFGSCRGPKENEKWDQNCYKCAVGKVIREKFAGVVETE